MNETMQFRDFIFRHNPQSITVTQPSGAVTLFCPGRGEVVQELGGRGRLVRCKGSFFGESFREAAAELERFRRCAGEAATGTLLLPGMAPMRAHLRELVFEAAGDGKILPYTMLFVEAGEEA